MVQNANIRTEQIAKARRLLRDLPDKQDRKTRPEAAELLEADFRKAKEKGYSPSELSQMLKNEGIIIPAYLIRKHFYEQKTNGTQGKPRNNTEKKISSEVTPFMTPNDSDDGVRDDAIMIKSDG